MKTSLTITVDPQAREIHNAMGGGWQASATLTSDGDPFTYWRMPGGYWVTPNGSRLNDAVATLADALLTQAQDGALA